MPKAGKSQTPVHSFFCASGADNQGFPGYFQLFHTGFCAEFNFQTRSRTANEKISFVSDELAAGR